MAIGDDFSIATNGDIRHESGTSTYTVLELHRWLQDLADDAASSGDDHMDITMSTPSERSTDEIITLNSPYNIDDDAAQYLYGGSISQKDGDELYAGLKVVGRVNNSNTVLQIVQNNSLYDGDSPFWGTGLNDDPDNNVLLRVLVKVRSGGNDIDNKKVRVFARELGDTFAEFEVTLGLGESTAAIFTDQDLNNQTDASTIAGWTDITKTEGYQQIDLGNGNGDRPYYIKWDKGSRTINQLYERTKWITRRGTSETMFGLDGELFRGITHEWDYDNEANGPFQETETLSWGSGSTAGTGLLIALKDDGTTGTMWIQLLTGVPPSDNMQISGGTSGATCDVNGSVTARTIPAHILGTSTSSAIIGAFGVGVDPNDLTKDDKLFDLTNTQQVPPNNVTFYVAGLVSGEDRVLVGPKDTGNDFDFDQLTLNGDHASSSTTVTVNESIPSDTPSSGTIRVKCDDNVYHRVEYTSWSGSVFTLSGTLGANASDGTDVMISYIDKLAEGSQESFTVVYSSDRDLFVRVRDGGTTPIKTFESPASLTSGGGSVTAIRTSDE